MDVKEVWRVGALVVDEMKLRRGVEINISKRKKSF